MKQLDQIITDLRNATDIELTLIKKANENSKSKVKNYDVKTAILDKSVTEDIRDKTISYLDFKDKKLTFSDYAIQKYNKNEDGFTIKATEVPNFNILLKQISEVLSDKENQNTDKICLFKMKELEKLNPNVFAIKFICKDRNEKDELIENSVIIFNSQTATGDIQKKTFALWEGEKFVCTKEAITLKNDVDCIYSSRNGLLYIISKPNFERIFDFKLYIRLKAEECLKKIKEQNAISDYESFKKKCLNDDTLTYHIATISIHSGIIPYKSFLSEIKNIVTEDKIPLEFDNQNKIIFDEKSDKKIIKEILKLLSDDKLSSRITKRKYEQGSFLTSLKDFFTVKIAN